MASSKRERDLGRMRAERQAARRVAAEAARRKRRQTLLATIGALVAVAIVLAVVLLVSDGGKNKDKLTSPKASASAVACTYTTSAKAAKVVAGKPPTKPLAAKSAALTTNRGLISLTLNAAKAPCTVNSFAFLAKQKYFDGTPCHRLTTSGIFVLQCGDPGGTGKGGPGYQFGEENLKGAVYPRGTVAMARTKQPGTNGSQFFLVYKDSPLPADYTPFGTITKGLDVIDKVAKAGSANGAGDGKPKLAVTIMTATVA